MFKVFFEDINVGDKQTYGAYEVTRDEVIEFASKYDPQPFHLNDEIAKQSVFGQICASGWHTCSMTMRMLVDNMMKQGFASMGSPGIDAIRWKKPVYPGETLHVVEEIIEKSEKEGRKNIGVIKTHFIVKNQDDVTVMTFTANAMVLKRG